MVDHPAAGVHPADPRAGVHTVQRLAGLAAGAVRVDGAFRSACDVGISKIFRDALAGASPVSIRAQSVLATWRWVARIYNFCGCKGCKQTNINNIILLQTSLRLTSCDPPAGGESIALISWIATTLRRMIGHMTAGVEAADPGAGVHAVLGHAGQVARTFGVHRALRLTCNVRVARVVQDAGAGGGLVPLSTHCVGAAGGGVAGINYLNWQDCARF